MNAILRSDGWRHNARMACGRRERMLGLLGRPEGDSMLFKTRSVHGFGMRHPIAVVAIGRDSTVIGSTVLGPNRIAFYRSARYLLELPIGLELPAIGSRVEIGFEDG